MPWPQSLRPICHREFGLKQSVPCIFRPMDDASLTDVLTLECRKRWIITTTATGICVSSVSKVLRPNPRDGSYGDTSPKGHVIQVGGINIALLCSRLTAERYSICSIKYSIFLCLWVVNSLLFEYCRALSKCIKSTGIHGSSVEVSLCSPGFVSLVFRGFRCSFQKASLFQTEYLQTIYNVWINYINTV
jgi:hypothetical protein